MATIFSSPDTAPLNSVIISRITVTTLSILSRGWLFTVGVRTDCGWSYLRKLLCPRLTDEREEEEEEEEEEDDDERGGGSERLNMWGEGQENITPVWKVPRQCPLVLLVWVTCTFFIFLYFFLFFLLMLLGWLLCCEV
jgi:hypothetical protein